VPTIQAGLPKGNCCHELPCKVLLVKQIPGAWNYRAYLGSNHQERSDNMGENRLWIGPILVWIMGL
jgi:hypothetical protein